ncbi:MAG TPA: helix-turn-helix domain-containing protein [Acidobacteriota bacterium]|nr:helix-turn-helix domain-containing protein [Acidobacteriota bacterium]
MSGKPYRSSLIPFEQEIFELRRRRPPMTYAQIANHLREEHHVSIRRETIFKFIKVRSRGRRAYFVLRQAATKKSAAVVQAATPVSTVVDPQFVAKNTEGQSPKPKFEFEWSERYNLTRLPPEVAAARRKKLEEKGH